MQKLVIPAVFAAVAVAGLPAVSVAGKLYEVTGKVVESSDKTIVVEKDGDKWEVVRSEDTKVEGGDVAKGAKAKVVYEMVARKVEVKAGETTSEGSAKRTEGPGKKALKTTGEA